MFDVAFQSGRSRRAERHAERHAASIRHFSSVEMRARHVGLAAHDMHRKAPFTKRGRRRVWTRVRPHSLKEMQRSKVIMRRADAGTKTRCVGRPARSFARSWKQIVHRHDRRFSTGNSLVMRWVTIGRMNFMRRVMTNSAREVWITPAASQPGQPAYQARGIYNHNRMNIALEDGSTFVEQETILDILARRSFRSRRSKTIW